MTQVTCSIDECDKAPSGGGTMCVSHRRLALVAKRAALAACSGIDCPDGAFLDGLCRKHRRLAIERERVASGDICSHPECGRARSAKGLCNIHYHRQRSGLPMDSVRIRFTKDPEQCIVHGCPRDVTSRRMCQMHYVRVLKHGATEHVLLRPRGKTNLCEIEGCPSPCEDDGLCAGHRAQVADGVELVRHSRRRVNNGYVTVALAAEDPRRKPGQRSIAEHRLVLEGKIGRALLPGESAHHVDGNRMNNAPENLELWVVTQPAGQRAADLVEHARRILERYGDPA